MSPEQILIDEDRIAENRVSSTEYLKPPVSASPKLSDHSNKDTITKSFNRTETEWSDVESIVSINADAEPIASSNNTSLSSNGALQNCINILTNAWKSLALATILFILFISGKFIGWLDGKHQFWLMWISTNLFMYVVMQLFSVLVVAMVKALTDDHWTIFYADSIGEKITPVLVVTYAFLSFTYVMDTDYFYEDTDVEDNMVLLYFNRFLRCIAILFWTLLCKTIALKYLAIVYYFQKYDSKIKRTQNYVFWIKKLMSMKKTKIFSKNTLKFLFYNIEKNQHQNHEFRLTALENEDLSRFLKDHDKINTVLWEYNQKRNQTTVISDDELRKICKIFAKVLVSKALQHCDTKTQLPHFNEANMLGTFRKLLPKSRKASVEHPDYKMRKFLTEYDFIYIFGNANKKKARKAFEAMDYQKTGEITAKSLYRKLYRFIRDLVYLKQTFDSYHQILANLDAVAGITLGFILIFVFLLIFNFMKFEESLSMYVSILVAIAIFCRNGFSSLFDSVTFVFYLAPYSIGDNILMGDKWYTVQSISLLSTEMKDDRGILTIFNNAELLKHSSNRLIKNLTRSHSCYHDFQISVSQNTTTQQLDELKTKFQTFLEDRMGPDINDLWFTCHGVDENCRMVIWIRIGTYISWADGRTRWKQHHHIMTGLREIIMKMGIEYYTTYNLMTKPNQFNISKEMLE